MLPKSRKTDLFHHPEARRLKILPSTIVRRRTNAYIGCAIHPSRSANHSTHTPHTPPKVYWSFVYVSLIQFDSVTPPYGDRCTTTGNMYMHMYMYMYMYKYM